MTTKSKKCPKCGNTDLDDRWSGEGRTLRQSCRAILDDDWKDGDYTNEFDHNTNMCVRVCNWEGGLRTPETVKVTGMREAWAAVHGSRYATYDRFGHTMGDYNPEDTDAKTLESIFKILERGLTDADAGPYKAVWWRGQDRKGHIYDGSTNPPTLVERAKTKATKETHSELLALCDLWMKNGAPAYAREVLKILGI